MAERKEKTNGRPDNSRTREGEIRKSYDTVPQPRGQFRDLFSGTRRPQSDKESESQRPSNRRPTAD